MDTSKLTKDEQTIGCGRVDRALAPETRNLQFKYGPLSEKLFSAEKLKVAK